MSRVSPSDWQRWLEALEAGAEPAGAAATLGLSCSAFRQADRVRHAEAMALSREARLGFVDQRVEGWALAEDATDAMRIHWSKRWNAAYWGASRLELQGRTDGKVEVVLAFAEPAEQAAEETES